VVVNIRVARVVVIVLVYLNLGVASSSSSNIADSTPAIE
jgi:hypothetical protein